MNQMDENTMHTAEDALVAKCSCIELKYMNDIYSKYFYKKIRKSPIINRGKYVFVCYDDYDCI
mgnify:FL=1